jgi:hypothetical protein
MAADCSGGQSSPCAVAPRGRQSLYLQGLRVSEASNKLGLLFTVKMEAVRSSKTSINFYQTRERHNHIHFMVTAVRTLRLTHVTELWMVKLNVKLSVGLIN